MSDSGDDASIPIDPQRWQIAVQAADDVTQIATLPEVTIKVIEIVEDPNSTANDLERIISHDPALCTRVLKVVNSAFYGLPSQVGSIQRAIVMLGLNSVKNIAIAGSLTRLFRGGRITPTFSARDVWEHSIGVAAGVSLLAKKVPLDLPDIAFHAGLIHDIGLMVEMQAMRTKLAQVLDVKKVENISFLEAELKVFGADHQDFGIALARAWKFPEAMGWVAGFHHRPMEIDEAQRPLASLVYAADRIVAKAEIGYTGTVDDLEIDPDVLETLKMTPKVAEEVATELPEAYRLANEILN